MGYVFAIHGGKRYGFPTHINDLVVDRSDACASEVFVVSVKPGMQTHSHKHEDIEQIFYVIDGEGTLVVGPALEQYDLRPSDVAKVPPQTLHFVKATGAASLRYLCVDCFCQNGKRSEPTWDEHVRAVCRQQGYSYEDVISFTGK